jgi:2-alkyl-3-oxoalkanoate reductase
VRILVTGASGFIASLVIGQALARGHHVVALSRLPRPDGRNSPVRWFTHDLSSANSLMLKGRGIDAVVHLAAAIAGSATEQQRATVHATRQLIAAVHHAAIMKLIGISSLAVLDYARMPPGTLIDEYAATSDGHGMGTYARTKLAQETLFAEFLGEPQALGSILRPGIVYDERRLIGAHAGISAGFLRLLVSHGGEVPVVEAGALATAIVTAVERDMAGCQIMHLIDDNLPDLQRYVSALRRRGQLSGGEIHVPWRVLAAGALAVRSCLSVVGQHGRLPEALRRHGFAARLKPFRYANSKAKRLLSWEPGNCLV